MNAGQVISGLGHLGLIGWAVFGGAFESEPMPFEVTEVTAISAEDYAALTQGPRAPDAVANVDTPEPPAAGGAGPELSPQADAAPRRARPETSAPATPDAAPEVPQPAAPAEAEVEDAAPTLQPPQEDVAMMVPQVSPRPKPRPAPRVAPEPVAPPDPDVRVDEVERRETAPDPDADTAQEQTEATAPEEAATEIVTEAEQSETNAPARSVRPRSRPARPDPAPEPDPPETETARDTPQEPQVDDSAVEQALAAAMNSEAGGETAPETPQGPPLTSGEKDALRVAVQRCWNVGSLSSEALRTTVVVGVQMNEDATPVIPSIELLESVGGSGDAARQAFEAARRAIIRCGARGYDLPREKFGQWRDIEMTFNPEKMRIK